MKALLKRKKYEITLVKNDKTLIRTIKKGIEATARGFYSEGEKLGSTPGGQEETYS